LLKLFFLAEGAFLMKAEKKTTLNTVGMRRRESKSYHCEGLRVFLSLSLFLSRSLPGGRVLLGELLHLFALLLPDGLQKERKEI